MNTLTIVFKSVSVKLRLQGTKRDLASVAQDSALPVTDLNSVDLGRTKTVHQNKANQRSVFYVQRFHW